MKTWTLEPEISEFCCVKNHKSKRKQFMTRKKKSIRSIKSGGMMMFIMDKKKCNNEMNAIEH